MCILILGRQVSLGGIGQLVQGLIWFGIGRKLNSGGNRPAHYGGGYRGYGGRGRNGGHSGYSGYGGYGGRGGSVVEPMNVVWEIPLTLTIPDHSLELQLTS